MKIDFDTTKTERVAFTDYENVDMRAYFVNGKVRYYELIVDLEDSPKYKYLLWQLQGIPVLYKIPRFINTIITKRRILKLGGRFK